MKNRITKTKIAIIDDDRALCDHLEYLLTGDGRFEIVLRRENGYDAAELIRRHEPDILILDHLMPGKDGFAVLEDLRADKVCVPYLLFTPSSESRWVKQQIARHGIRDYLLKPYDLRLIYNICSDLHVHMKLTPGFSEDLLQFVRDKNMALLLREAGAEAYEEERNKSYLRDIFTQGGIAFNCLGLNYMIESALVLKKKMDDRVRIYDIYASVAELFDVTQEAVERSIRTAVRNAWKKRCEDPILYDDSLLFAGFRQCPTNKEILMHVANLLRKITEIYTWYR